MKWKVAATALFTGAGVTYVVASDKAPTPAQSAALSATILINSARDCAPSRQDNSLLDAAIDWSTQDMLKAGLTGGEVKQVVEAAKATKRDSEPTASDVKIACFFIDNWKKRTGQ